LKWSKFENQFPIRARRLYRVYSQTFEKHFFLHCGAKIEINKKNKWINRRKKSGKPIWDCRNPRRCTAALGSFFWLDWGHHIAPETVPTGNSPNGVLRRWRWVHASGRKWCRGHRTALHHPSQVGHIGAHPHPRSADTTQATEHWWIEVQQWRETQELQSKLTRVGISEIWKNQMAESTYFSCWNSCWRGCGRRTQ